MTDAQPLLPHDVEKLKALVSDLAEEKAALLSSLRDLVGQVEQARDGFGIYKDSPSMCQSLEWANSLLEGERRR